MMLETITAQAKAAAEQLLAVSKLSTGDIVVVGCSTSEVGGHAIGTDSVPVSYTHLDVYKRQGRWSPGG